MSGLGTYAALVLEHGTDLIPLDRVAPLLGLDPREARRRASRGRLPVPALRRSGQKSPWIVRAADLAAYVDRVSETARADWQRANGVAA
jgi:hypothetical protein